MSKRNWAAAAIIGWGLLGTPAPASAGDPVMEWNQIAQNLIVIPALSPVQQTRAMAIVHVAVHDAVNAFTNQYERYSHVGDAPAGATLDAAVVGAAYRSLAYILEPLNRDDLEASLDASYAASLATHGLSSADPGLAFGRSVADGIVALRQDDGAGSAAFIYIPAGAGTPGVWMPLSSALAAQSLLPGWGQVTPWVLRSGSQFRPDAPPALDSERYARDYNEVMQLGAEVNSTRSSDQTQIALFWRASPTRIWNPVLRQAIAARVLDVSEKARISALFYLAAADASVACWEAKYIFNFWRPQPAIVNGHLDGNDATPGDPTWRPLIGTPPHPEYPSGHTANSGAMAFVLARIFGDDPGYVIEATSSQNQGFDRRWLTFSEGVAEVIDARIYSGIHFRTADEVGARMGRQVAQFVLTHALRPVVPR